MARFLGEVYPCSTVAKSKQHPRRARATFFFTRFSQTKDVPVPQQMHNGTPFLYLSEIAGSFLKFIVYKGDETKGRAKGEEQLKNNNGNVN
jgi:hypothetical protein